MTAVRRGDTRFSVVPHTASSKCLAFVPKVEGLYVQKQKGKMFKSEAAKVEKS